MFFSDKKYTIKIYAHTMLIYSIVLLDYQTPSLDRMLVYNKINFSKHFIKLRAKIRYYRLEIHELQGKFKI